MGYRPRPYSPHPGGSKEHREQKIIEALEEWHERWEKIYKFGADNLLHERRYKNHDNAIQMLHLRLSLTESLLEFYYHGKWNGHGYENPNRYRI